MKPEGDKGVALLGPMGARAMNPIRLLFLPRRPGAPAASWIVDDGRLVGRGAFSPGHPDPHPGLRTLLVVPGEETLCRWLELPARRDAQALAAAAFLLEGETAVPRAQLHLALGPADSDGLRPVVVVDRARMQAWLDEAAALGVSPDAVAPDCLLPPQPDGEAIVAIRLGEVYAVRGPGLALTCEAELLPLVMGERAYVALEDRGEAERLLALGADRPLTDLRQGDFALPRTAAGRRARGPLVLAAVLLALVLAVPAVRALRHDLAARQALAEAEALAGPAEGTGADPATRLRAQLVRLQAAERFPAAMAALVAAVEQIDGMELHSLAYGEDGDFRLSAAHANYTDVELLRRGLAGSGLVVEETGVQTQAGRLVSDLVLRPAP